MVFEDEVDGAGKLPKPNIILVDKSKVPRYIWIDGLDLHVCGCGAGGLFVSHKPLWEGAHLVEGQTMELSQDIFIIDEVCIPVIDANDCLCFDLEQSSYCGWYIHGAAEAKLDCKFFE